MKVGVYPGSFNPWREGHTDIVRKALKVFDKVIIASGINPDKPDTVRSVQDLKNVLLETFEDEMYHNEVVINGFSGLLVDFVKKHKATAVIRGLRNGHDLQYEMNQQYWNEDLGMDAPIVYFICDRKLSHISSSAIRAVEKIKSSKPE